MPPPPRTLPPIPAYPGQAAASTVSRHPARPPEMRRRPDQIGAGLYVLPEGDREKLSLVGLVSGSVTLRTDQGERELLAVAGPQQLWRLVTHRRDVLRRRPWVYREDVL